MAKHKYHYHGETDVHLPEQGIFAKGGEGTTVYYTDTPINHPDFKETEQGERKESKSAK